MLFDLENDPGEQINCIEQHPDVAARFEALAQAVFHEREGSKADRVELDEDTVRSLEALGYL